jgi:hypothetical protein
MAHRPEDRIEQLRVWRNPRSRDLTLGNLPEYVKKTYAKPHKQLGQIAELWQQFIPAALAGHTSLVSLTRGVLLVHVADAAALFELDRLLRTGVEQQIRQASKAPLRSVKLKVAANG